MAFNFGLYFRLYYASLFKSAGTDARLTPKRRRFLLLFFLGFGLLEFFAWLGFLCDEIFFRGYRKQKIERPVFMLGNPRAGTTFLDRVMAKDTETFLPIRTWEIVLAPSVTQRHFWKAVAALDRRLGSPLRRRVVAAEQENFSKVKMHRFGIWEPEEDDFILFHIFSTLFVSLFFPFPQEMPNYAAFDLAIPPAERKRIMTFYRKCVQRHLYFHGGKGQFLSKNPAFTPKIDALYEYFPDAKIIYLARNPLDMLPSLASWMAYQYKAFWDPKEKYPGKEDLMEMTKAWYHFPLDRLAKAPEDAQAIVKYDDLVRDPGRVVTDLYRRFGFPLSPAYAQTLRVETAKAGGYKSEHLHPLEEIGYDRQQILNDFRDVFERFGFDTGEEQGKAAVEADDEQ
ncbi:MAG: sulfotransferase [Chloroflexi bacterium]|nr:sulfotransferase [Chloroflexota bacterium]